MVENRNFSYPPFIQRAPVDGVPVGMLPWCLVRKKLEWCGYPMVKKNWKYVYSFRQNVRTWQTDGQTDTAWWHRPRLHSIARKNHMLCRLSIRSPVAFARFPWFRSDTIRL